MNLHYVNFANSDLRQSVFSDILGGLMSVALSQDGKLLATGNAKRHVRLWQVRTGQQLLTLRGHTNWVRSVAFSADGKILAILCARRVCFVKVGEGGFNLLDGQNQDSGACLEWSDRLPEFAISQ